MGLLNGSEWHAKWIERKRDRPLTEAEMFEDDQPRFIGTSSLSKRK